MNKYILSVRVKGTVVKTAIYADSPYHAQLICEYIFGIGSVTASARLATNEDTSCEILEEIAKFTKPIKPLNPQQARINSLKQQKDIASKALQRERDRQTISKAQSKINNVITKH